MMPVSLLAIPLLPLASFALTLLLGKRWGTRAHWLPIITVLASFFCALIAFFRVRSGIIINEDIYTWIHSGDMKVSVGFLVDQLTAVMLIVVTSISSLVHIYSVGYMKGEEGYYRFFAYLSLFTFSMLMLVLGNNFLQLFFGWEAVGLSSYLLIGFYFNKQSAADAGKKALLSTDSVTSAFLSVFFSSLPTSGASIIRRCSARLTPLPVRLFPCSAARLTWLPSLRSYCFAVPSVNRLRSRYTSGCPMPWRARHRSVP